MSMEIRMIIVAVLIAFVCATANAQNIKRPGSYNFLRGVEAYEKDNLDEANDYFDKEISDNPKNGYAYLYKSAIYYANEDYGKVISLLNKALKYIQSKDLEYIPMAYRLRMYAYICLEDTAKALADATTIIDLCKGKDECYEYIMKTYEQRAQLYYEQGKYDLADADYRKMIEIDEANVYGYMGLGRNAIAEKRYDEAIALFNKVEKLTNNDYSSVYSFRAECYLALEKWNEATDDILNALNIDNDRKARWLLSLLEEPAFSMMVSKLKLFSSANPKDVQWPNYIAHMYEIQNNYNNAIKWYSTAIERDAYEDFFYHLSICQNKIGDNEAALRNINQALNIDSVNSDYIEKKADILYDMYHIDDAITELDKLVDLYPKYAPGYYQRASYKAINKDYEGALDDYMAATIFYSDYSFVYLGRAYVYDKLGQKELAEADYKKVVKIETMAEEPSNKLFYAYQALGQTDKAVQLLNAILAKDTTNAGNYYDAACLYSRMNDKSMALEYLEKCLSLGYNQFAHISYDYDMDNIRETAEFKSLIAKYNNMQTSASVVKSVSNMTNTNKKETITSSSAEIPFIKEDGVCKVKCDINGLPLHFVFDTGASDVTISMVEATFMMKNGYLNNKDVVGSQRYIDANGDVSVGTVLNLNKVNFGGMELKNVRASVVRNQKAPLLLGQSVLGRLGKIEIDNSKRVLKISNDL